MSWVAYGDGQYRPQPAARVRIEDRDYVDGDPIVGGARSVGGAPIVDGASIVGGAPGRLSRFLRAAYLARMAAA